MRRPAAGTALCEVAVERDGDALGRCRMQVVPNTAAAAQRAFLLAHVEPGSVVLSDGFSSYPSACGEDHSHRPEPIAASGLQAHELLPGVHRVAALAKRWLLSTHQGGVKPGHLQVLGRVHVPLQPQTLTSQGHALLPPARTGRAGPATHLPLVRARPRRRSPDHPAPAAEQASPMREPGRRSPRPAMASGGEAKHSGAGRRAVRWLARSGVPSEAWEFDSSPGIADGSSRARRRRVSRSRSCCAGGRRSRAPPPGERAPGRGRGARESRP